MLDRTVAPVAQSQYPAEDLSIGNEELQSRLDNSTSLLSDIEREQRDKQRELQEAKQRLEASKQSYEEVRACCLRGCTVN